MTRSKLQKWLVACSILNRFVMMFFPSLVSRPSHHPVVDGLQYAKITNVWVIKNWTVGRPRSKASSYDFTVWLLISQSYTVQTKVCTDCISVPLVYRNVTSQCTLNASPSPNTRALKTVFRGTCRWSQRQNNSWHCSTVRERRYTVAC